MDIIDGGILAGLFTVITILAKVIEKLIDKNTDKKKSENGDKPLTESRYKQLHSELNPTVLTEQRYSELNEIKWLEFRNEMRGAIDILKDMKDDIKDIKKLSYDTYDKVK